MDSDNPSTSKSKHDQAKMWQLIAEGDWLSGQSFSIDQRAILGRDSSCDIIIPGTHLSRRHAEIIVTGNKLLVRDLGSSNGTYINDQRVNEAELNSGDHIRFDVLRFRVQGPQQPQSDNLTMIRPAISAAEAQAKTQPNPVAGEKQWRNKKPTSLGNRDQTVVMSAKQKAASSLWTILAVLLGLGTFAALGWLFLHL